MSKLDTELSKLRDIGIEQIQKITKLSDDNINMILDKHFDASNESRIKGTIYILERDMDVDLSGWMVEYRAHINQEKAIENDREKDKLNEMFDTLANKTLSKSSQNTTKPIKKTAPQKPQDVKQNDIQESPSTKESLSAKDISNQNDMDEIKAITTESQFNKNDGGNRKIYTIIMVIMVLIGLAYLVYNRMNSSSNIKPVVVPMPQVEIPLEPEIVEPNEDNVSSQYYQGLGYEQESPQESTQELAPLNIQSDTTNDNADSNTTINPSDTITQNTNERLSQEIVNTQVNTISDLQVSIYPEQMPLWVGVFSIDTKMAEQFTINTKKDINIKPGSVIVLGHGYVGLRYNDKTDGFSVESPIKFQYTKNGEFKRITNREYLQLSDGVVW